MTEIKKLEERVRNWLETEYRRDELYRYPVLQSQLGDIAKYIYHDKEYNPEARVFGTRNDEITLHGEAMCHLIALMISRGINVSDAFEKGIKKLEDKDGYRKKGKCISSEGFKTLEGIPASPGKIEGTAFVIKKSSELESLSEVPKDSILIAQHLTPDAIASVRILRFKGIVTDTGSSTCHAAIVANELKIPCVAGTEKVTMVVNNNDKLAVNGTTGTVTIMKGDEK